MRRDQAEARVAEDLRANPQIERACKAILEFAASRSEEVLQHITFGALARASQLADPSLAVVAIQYLTGDRVHLLEPRFEFIDGDLIEAIEISEVNEARRNGTFYHPETGDLVTDFESKLIVHFVLSDMGKSLRNSSSV